MIKGRCSISADVLLFIACLVFSWHAAIEFTVHFLKVNGHCVLFGQIFEMKRLFIDGYISLCWLFQAAQYILGIAGLNLAAKCSLYQSNSLFNNKQSRILLFGSCLLSLFMAFIFSAGFYSVCNSLDSAPVCNEETIWNIEFKYFTPKYFDASHFYSQYERITMSIWLNTLCFWGGFIRNMKKLERI